MTAAETLIMGSVMTQKAAEVGIDPQHLKEEAHTQRQHHHSPFLLPLYSSLYLQSSGDTSWSKSLRQGDRKLLL